MCARFMFNRGSIPLERLERSAEDSEHIKTFMSAVFKLAKQQGYYTGENPVRDTATSPRAKAPHKNLRLQLRRD